MKKYTRPQLVSHVYYCSEVDQSQIDWRVLQSEETKIII